MNGETCYFLQYHRPAPIVSKMGVLPKAFRFTVEALVGMTSFIAVFITSSSDACVSTSVQTLRQSIWCHSPVRCQGLFFLLPLSCIQRLAPAGSFCWAYNVVPITFILKTNTLLDVHMQGSWLLQVMTSTFGKHLYIISFISHSTL